MSQVVSDHIYIMEERGKHIDQALAIYQNVDDIQGQEIKADTERKLQTQLTGGDTAERKCLRLTVMCLILLCVLLVAAVTVLWVKFSIVTTENGQLHTSYDNLNAEQIKLLTGYKDLESSFNNLTVERNQLQKERDEFKSGLSALNDCFKQGWTYFNYRMHYISMAMTDWYNSRQDCMMRGADLIIINTKEEEDFIMKMLGSDRAWIGLTDGVTEGDWKWVDGTKPNITFWKIGEPNEYVYGEDCAEAFIEPPYMGWNDYVCNLPKRWICEKALG